MTTRNKILGGSGGVNWRARWIGILRITDLSSTSLFWG